MRLVQYSGANAYCLEATDLRLYFSYETLIAFDHSSTGLVVSENVWSKTTGKHLNAIDGGDKKKRIPYDAFQQASAELFDELGL